MAAAAIVAMKRMGSKSHIDTGSQPSHSPNVNHHAKDEAPKYVMQESDGPVTVLQRAIRSKLLYNQKFHRFNFAERLIFESSMVTGTLRLINQLIIFSLLVASLRMSSDETVKLGIYEDMDSTFGFQDLKSISSRDDFMTRGMQSIATNSKPYFPLSSRYFSAGKKSAIELQGPREAFSRAKIGVPLDIYAPDFSFSVWVRAIPQFLDGYIVRKAPAPAGEGSHLSCWAWYLHRYRGPELHYGAHDYDGPSQGEGRQQYEIGLENPPVLEAEKDMMLTMVVTRETVAFYQDLAYLGTTTLPRERLTDCFNGGQGLLLGDTGLTMGVLRYYPMALTLPTITELHKYGSLLVDISQGSEPVQPQTAQSDIQFQTLSNGLSNVMNDVQERQDQLEMSMVLKTAQEKLSAQAAEVNAPNAPVGSLSFNQTVQHDADLGRDYYEIIKGPYRLSETFTTADHRLIRDFPDWRGRGSTWSFWYKHLPCTRESCGGYLFSIKSDDQPGLGLCFSYWIENTAIYFSNIGGNPSSHYPRNYVEQKFEVNGDKIWRHMAFVLDETNDHVKFYLDGKKAYDAYFGLPVTQVDCAGGDRRLTVGYREPLNTYPLIDVDIYDFRFYIHPASGTSPLSDADILTIARRSTPGGVSEDDKCLPIESRNMEDQSWKDVYEHSCEWYRQKASTHPVVCDYPEASVQCPLSCASRQECYDIPEDLPKYFTWDRIKRIESRHDNGTICLSDEMDKSTVYEQCKSWVQNGIPAPTDQGHEMWKTAYDWFQSNNPSGKQLNITDCEQLVSAIDPGCSFNMTAVRTFTQEMKENGGDYSIAFWVKPMGSQSMWPENGHFYPHVNFLASISPPASHLRVNKLRNPAMDVDFYASCADDGSFDNVETRLFNEEGWTFLAISRQNSTSENKVYVATNLEKSFEGANYDTCLFDPESFFSAIEINYPVLISAIMMIPKALPFARLQQMYLASAEQFPVRNGPRAAKQEADESSSVNLLKQDYSLRSVLIAPPLLFQTRTVPGESCQVAYSSHFIEQQHLKVQNSTCAPPFSCDDEVIQNSSEVLSCPATTKTEGTFFDQPVSTFAGDDGFAEFLFAITENYFLFREGKITPTEKFIDSMTQKVTLLLIFFSHETGVTSVMTVSANFGGYSSATVQVFLQHFEILEGANLVGYVAVQALVLVNIFFLVLDVVLNTKYLIQAYKESGELAPQQWIKQLLDFVTAGMTVAFIIIRIPSKMRSADDAEKVIGNLTAIPWDNQYIALNEKTDTFFSLLLDLQQAIDYDSFLNSFCAIILVISLLRLIQCTALHPRLALLTGTLLKALDDLWHACLLVGLLMGCFAGIATWRFGSEFQEFATLGKSMKVQFYMLFGHFPDIVWMDKLELQIYSFLYIIMLFFLVQNFLLAIIVEAYMQVRNDTLVKETEQEFFSDVYKSFETYAKVYYYGWPAPASVGMRIEKWNCKFNVTLADMMRTGCFKDQYTAGRFLAHYDGFDFLEPIEPLRKNPDNVAAEVERRLTILLRGKVQGMKEMAKEAIHMAETRRATKMASKHDVTEGVPMDGIEVANGQPLRIATFVNGGSKTNGGTAAPGYQEAAANGGTAANGGPAAPVNAWSPANGDTESPDMVNGLDKKADSLEDLQSLIDSTVLPSEVPNSK